MATSRWKDKAVVLSTYTECCSSRNMFYLVIQTESLVVFGKGQVGGITKLCCYHCKHQTKSCLILVQLTLDVPVNVVSMMSVHLFARITDAVSLMHHPFAPVSSLLLVKLQQSLFQTAWLDSVLKWNLIGAFASVSAFISPSLPSPTSLLSLSRLSFSLCWILFLVHQLSFPIAFSHSPLYLKA